MYHGECLKTGDDHFQLQDDDEDLEAIDVDVSLVACLEITAATDHTGGPDNFEPEPEAGAVGTTPREAGIPERLKMVFAGYNQTKVGRPRAVVRGNELAQGIQALANIGVHREWDGGVPEEPGLVSGQEG